MKLSADGGISDWKENCMKFLHTGDLHIGKKIFEQSLLEDQKVILDQIEKIAYANEVDAVLIAGDVYDRSVPSTEAVKLLDDFLTRLVDRGIKVIMISGNHDSPERVAFADRILEKKGLYIAGTYRDCLKTVTLTDDYGPVEIVCMPFVKPAQVNATNSAEAVEKMLTTDQQEKAAKAVPSPTRSVLITHYFVVGDGGEAPELSDSESDINVGGLDSVPAGLFHDFDYVALGHIHKPQKIGKGEIYYAGSPLKYSFSEAKGSKSVNLVTLKAPGEVEVERIALTPLHEMRCITGKLDELMKTGLLEQSQTEREDYIQATLTDTEELIDPIGSLRSVYPNTLQIILAKNKEQNLTEYESSIQSVKKSTEELFSEFYEMIKGEPLDDKRREIVREAAEGRA